MNHLKFTPYLFILFFGLSLGPAQEAQAQIGKKLKKKLEKKAGELLGVQKEKPEPEVEIEKQEKDSSQSQPPNMPNMSGMFGGGDTEMPDSYEFGSNIVMTMTAYNKKGKENQEESAEYVYLFPKNADDEYLGMSIKFLEERPEGNPLNMMIISEGNMISFTDQDGTKMAMSMSLDRAKGMGAGAQGNGDYENASIEKTGNTKTILGYSCEEYIMESDETEAHIWMASDLTEPGQQMKKMFTAFAREGYAPNSMNELMDSGMMLEMESINKKSGEKQHLIAKELNLDEETNFSTKEYQLMNMGDMMKMQQRKGSKNE